MAKLKDSFDMFGDPTEPRSGASTDRGPGAEEPVEAPANEQKPARPAKPARTPKPVEVPAEMDKAALARVRWQLGASARKAAADQQRAAESMRAWESVVAEARAGGVPERLLMAAALEADVDLPEGA